MGLSILERPLGIGLGDCVSANIAEDYANYATVETTLPHNLNEDDYVYVQSYIEDYNGFWPIHFIDGYHFFLKNSDGTYVAYIVDASITYCPESFRHGWSCVHLPITYKVKSTLWPVNSVDTARTVSSFTDDNGYTNLNLSGSLGTFNELQSIQISGAASDEVNGVFQVLDKVSSSDITINLAYDAGYSFTGGSVILYYSNYHVVVNIYSGLPSDHVWQSKKPYELASTLRFIPDSDNTIKFSINEILKDYINIRNNILLATLPNNLDFFTGFYIETAESYDQSDGTTITTYQSGFTSDQSNFEGMAANSILEFRNQHSGYLTDYVMNNTTAKFLTLFAIPVLFGCSDDYCYHDVSFIVDYKSQGQLSLKKKYYNNGNLIVTDDENINSYDQGIYRSQIDPNCLYDQLKISLFRTLSLPTLDNYQSIAGSFQNWTTGSSPTVSLSTGQQTDPLRLSYKLGAGTYNFTFAGTIGSFITLTVSFKKGDIIVYQRTFGSSSFSVTLTSGIDNIEFTASRINIIGTSSVTITSFDFTNNTAVQISEEKTYSIDCGCSNQEIRLSWLNNLGGFDYWKFTAFSEYIRNINDSGQTKENILPSWPNSYGENASTIRKQTYRESQKQILVRSQHVTLEELQALEYIKSSVLVEVIESRSSKRRVIVDTDSFTSHKDNDKLFSISFTITYTDDIPAQRI